MSFEINSLHWTKALLLFVVRTEGRLVLRDVDEDSCSVQDSVISGVPKMFRSMTVAEIESQKSHVHEQMKKLGGPV